MSSARDIDTVQNINDGIDEIVSCSADQIQIRLGRTVGTLFKRIRFSGKYCLPQRRQV